MKIYVIADMEGLAGIHTWDPVDKKSSEYATGRLLLTEEVNAVVEGAIEGGAKEIIVNDAHAGGGNLLFEKLHPGASYVEPSAEWLDELDESFNAVFLIGHHAMEGTQDGILCHTINGGKIYNYYLNGKRYSEAGIEAVMAGHYKVPVVFISGDLAIIREVKELLGENIEGVVVKEGYGRFAGKLLAPVKARQLIREGAKRAITKIGKVKPYILKPPIEVKLELMKPEYAEECLKFEGVKRIDARTVVKTVNSALDIAKLM